MVRFSYGNTYEWVHDAAPVSLKDSSCNKKLEHRWAVFVVLTSDKNATSQYIKSVTFSLPEVSPENHLPNYKHPSHIRIDHAPFILEQDTFTSFSVKLQIEFHEWTGIN